MCQKTDAELIEEVKNKSDDALEELIRRYTPLINNVKKRYYLRHFDYEDWDQEAMLICYESCCVYDSDRGVNFGGLFKVNLINHARSLLRSEMSKKRCANMQAVSYEVVNNSGTINEKITELNNEPVSDIYQNFLKNLSRVELFSMYVFLGLMSKEHACKMAQCSEYQISQAKARCKRKLKNNMGT